MYEAEYIPFEVAGKPFLSGRAEELKEILVLRVSIPTMLVRLQLFTIDGDRVSRQFRSR
jgi:hypothetical protein